ncbi:ABC transporter ATP-binding protein/permease [Odoribacter sp. OttesenSCG-928-J03]|nr:ABC transporter ATP-binding protein/permease [Odoribacter sp. OttesenSCG-928-J03]
MRRYWQILKRYKSGLLLSPLLVLVAVLCETIQPRFMAEIIDEGVMQKDISVVIEVGIYMLLVSVLGLIASVANVYVSSKTSIGFGTDLRASLFHKIQELSFSDIDRFNSASLITRLTNDVSKIQQVILTSMRIMLRSPLLLILAVFWVFHIHSDLALILLSVIPVLIIAAYIIFKKGYPFFLKVQRSIDALNAVVRENLINIRVVKAVVREDFETQKFTKSSEDLRDMVVRASNVIVTIFPVMQLVMNISIILILWFGGGMVMSGDLKVGELISFVNYLSQILMSLMMMSMIIMTFARASASSERIVEVLEAESSLTDTPEGLSGRHIVTDGRVEFKNVSFRYAGSENDVLRNISFQVDRGETVAVVGATGSAKSSMLQLIPRLYDVTQGEVAIDGVNVKNYSSDELHAKVGIVLQNNELFSGTIMDNLKWGNPEAAPEEIEQVAKTAQAHDFITSFPDGYNTRLGRGGVNISGGQKQRLCIARALLKKPKILILDDSTSAVDSETEQKIRTNLYQLLGNTTVFVITQRVHTMHAADKVIVLDDGKIESIGTPLELMETSSTYREIYDSQTIII